MRSGVSFLGFVSSGVLGVAVISVIALIFKGPEAWIVGALMSSSVVMVLLTLIFRFSNPEAFRPDAREHEGSPKQPR